MSGDRLLQRLIAMRSAIAEIVPLNRLAIPIFERLDEEVRKAEAMATTDPVARARALARSRDQMAID